MNSSGEADIPGVASGGKMVAKGWDTLPSHPDADWVVNETAGYLGQLTDAETQLCDPSPCLLLPAVTPAARCHAYCYRARYCYTLLLPCCCATYWVAFCDPSHCCHAVAAMLACCCCCCHATAAIPSYSLATMLAAAMRAAVVTLSAVAEMRSLFSDSMHKVFVSPR